MENSVEQEKRKVPVIEVDEGQLRVHASEVVRQSVEETLNGLLEAEADALCNARRYERNAERASTRAGHYQRAFQTTAPRSSSESRNCAIFPLKQPLSSGIAAGKALSKRRWWKCTWRGIGPPGRGHNRSPLEGRVSPSTISDLNQKIFERVEAWRNRALEREYPYVFVDGTSLKRALGGEVETVSVLVAIGVNQEGYREVLGVAEGSREDLESWCGFLRYLKNRGLEYIRLLVSDKSLGLLEAL